MSRIVLTPQQARVLAEAKDEVVLCAPSGEVLARLASTTDTGEREIVAESKRRLATPQRRYTTQQALALARKRAESGGRGEHGGREAS